MASKEQHAAWEEAEIAECIADERDALEGLLKQAYEAGGWDDPQLHNRIRMAIGLGPLCEMCDEKGRLFIGDGHINGSYSPFKYRIYACGQEHADQARRGQDITET